MIAEDVITHWLRADAASCLNVAKFADALLKHGCWFRKRASSNDYETTKLWRKTNRPRIKQCYYNSQIFCCEHESARYFEGDAATHDTAPFRHAWIVMPDGFVVDFTLEALERSREGLNGTHRPAEVLYFGVEVPQRLIREAMLSSGFIEPVAPRLFSKAN
jgi:hypothetical protein